MFAELLPHGWSGFVVAGHFKVVYVDAEEQLVLLVEEQAFPADAFFETASLDGFMTVLFPVQPREGVAVEVKFESANGVPELAPASRLSIPGNRDPSLFSEVIRLSVGAHSVTVFAPLTGHPSDGVEEFGSSEVRCRSSLFREHR